MVSKPESNFYLSASKHNLFQFVRGKQSKYFFFQISIQLAVKIQTDWVLFIVFGTLESGLRYCAFLPK